MMYAYLKYKTSQCVAFSRSTWWPLQWHPHRYHMVLDRGLRGVGCRDLFQGLRGCRDLR